MDALRRPKDRHASRPVASDAAAGMAVEQDVEQRDARAVFPEPHIEHRRKAPFRLGARPGPAARQGHAGCRLGAILKQARSGHIVQAVCCRLDAFRCDFVFLPCLYAARAGTDSVGFSSTRRARSARRTRRPTPLTVKEVLAYAGRSSGRKEARRRARRDEMASWLNARGVTPIGADSDESLVSPTAARPTCWLSMRGRSSCCTR